MKEEEKSVESPDSGYPIVVYDSYCVLCSSAVRFILKHEKKPEFRFLSLESKKASEILSHIESPGFPDSVLLIEKAKVYVESDAALRISGKLKFPYCILIILKIIPRIFRDPFYRIIARKRYRWFGRKNTCFLPEKKWEYRFLD